MVVIGDIHGRFHRVREWIAALESARGLTASLVLAVGDVEAFLAADDHRRKAAKRAMPAEFADYVSGRCAFERPMHFIGGNNEDFEALHAIPAGGPIASNLHYLGRVGAKNINGFDVAWLSGIYAPRYVDKPLQPPTSPDTCRQAGYFRRDEVRVLDSVVGADILLTHEWPRGLAVRSLAASRGVYKDLKAFHTPWVGNQVARALVERIRPRWLFCGHSHVAFASVVRHNDGTETRIACLDQASRSDGAVFWTEWQDGRAVVAGWGISGEVCWRDGQVWDERRTPACGVAPKSVAHLRVPRASARFVSDSGERATNAATRAHGECEPHRVHTAPTRPQHPCRRDADTSGVHGVRSGHDVQGGRRAPQDGGDGAPLELELERKVAGGER